MGTLGGIFSHIMRESNIRSYNRTRDQINRLNESAANMNKFTEDGSEMPQMKLGDEPSGIDKVLAERKSTYGDYGNNAMVTQGIMSFLMMGENAGALNDNHKEGLHMIAHKMSRIVNGDPNLHDSWDDIIGYARCVVDRIHNRPVKS